MLGIQSIASYLPETKKSNYDVLEKFEINETFIENKLGIKYVRIKNTDHDSSDLCVESYKALERKIIIDKNEIECLIVVTQNPDFNLPHCSAIVHGKLDMPEECACFDISLGCSGYVYGLSVIKSFMTENNMKKGLIFTADPYSKIIDPNDKNTSMLFGDGSTVSLISDAPKVTLGKFSFGTIGKKYESLICRNGVLYMDGFDIFSFASKYIPLDFEKVLSLNGLNKDEIDCFVFHQGSKYIVDTLRKKLNLPKEKVYFDIEDYGNTVSSSIPMILEKVMTENGQKKIFISGFGVGLSWASGIIYKN